jgi:peptidoglycan biosynthesis protein MviN/MurJ (putative lipid II flippase)
MLKKIILRGALGFPLGICIGNVIAIALSLAIGNGRYLPCVPSLIDVFGSEIAAVVFQAIMCGVLGSAYAAASVVWEVEKWGIAKQTGTYALICAIVMMPIAYFTQWMEHSVSGFLLYFGIWLGIFVIVWIIQYFIWKYIIGRVNSKIKEQSHTP